MAWLNELTTGWRIRNSFFIYGGLFVALGWLIGLGIGTGLEKIRFAYLRGMSLRPVGAIHSLTEKFLLSEVYSWLSELIVPISVLLGLWMGYHQFYRDKIQPWLQIGLGDESDRQVDQLELPRQAQRLREQQAKADQALVHSQIRLKRLDSQVAHLMHELKTPLTTIRGDIELLGLLSQAKQLDEIASRLARNEQRLEHLISRFSAGMGEQEIEMNVSDWNQLWMKIRRYLNHHSPPVTFDPPKDLSGRVRIDEEIFFSALVEIISNASRYTQKRIMMRVARQGDEMCLTICDDGPAFTPEALNRATEAYYTEHPGKGHIGYGLYQVERQLRRMDIELELINDKGACVRLRLPRHR